MPKSSLIFGVLYSTREYNDGEFLTKIHVSQNLPIDTLIPTYPDQT